MSTALYCKILVLLGLCFTLSETITDEIESGFYKPFQTFLILGSLLFLLFFYVDLIRYKALIAAQNHGSKLNQLRKTSIKWLRKGRKAHRGDDVVMADPDVDQVHVDDGIPRPKNVYGSLYLRLGAVCKLFYLSVHLPYEVTQPFQCLASAA